MVGNFYKDDGIGLNELVHIILKNYKIFVIVFISIILVCILYTGNQDRYYTATTTVSVESFRNLTTWNGQRTETKTVAAELQHLTSQSNLIKALKTMNLSNYKNHDGTDYHELLENSNKLKVLQGNIRTSVTKDTNSVTITLEHQNPIFAQDFLTTLITTFNKSLLDFVNIQLTIERQSLQDRLANSSKRIEDAKDSLKVFQKETGIVELEANRGIYQRILTLIQLEKSGVIPTYSLIDLKTHLVSLGFSEEVIANRFKNYFSTYKSYLYDTISHLLIIDNTSNTELETRNPILAQALISLDLSMIDWLLSIGINNADAANLSLQIGNTIRHQILSEEESYYLSKINAYADLEYEYSEHKNALARETNESIQIKELLKAFDAFLSTPKNPTLYIDPVRLIDEEGESKNFLLFAFGVLLAGFLALFSVLTREYFSDSISNEYVLQRILRNESHFLSIIPREANSSLQDFEILNHPASKKSIAYDHLAGTLQNFSSQKVFTISSLSCGEGNAFIAMNLSISFLRSGQRILLVRTCNEELDCHEILSKICANKDAKDLIQMSILNLDNPIKQTGELSKLHIVSIDVASFERSRVLHSQQFANYIKNASNSFDLILIDGPPFEAASDFLAVAKVSEGIILNVKASVGSRKQLKNLIHTLKFCKIPLLGVILNNMRAKPYSMVTV